GTSGIYNVVDDEASPVSEFLPAVADIVGAKPPLRVPVWLGRLLAGEVAVRMMTEARGASNAKAKRELGWQPIWPSWRDGFRRGLQTPVPAAKIAPLRSARVRRETYVGEWLPEPLVSDPGSEDPAVITERAESLSMSFLLLLERLSPVERAVFLLHDVFDYGFDEIAAIVGRTPATCRQHAVRARRHIEANRPRFDASPAERDELLTQFFAAANAGHVDGLIEMLAEDVILYGDGGGKVPQWAGPIAGADRVA